MAAPSRLVPDRDDILALLGGEIGRVRFEGVEVRSRREEGGSILEDLAFASSTGEVVPGWFARPAGAGRPAAAVLYCHAHGHRYEIGRRELVDGRPALQARYLDDLAGLGLAVLCLEMPCFGARALPDEDTRSKELLWHGRTLFGRMLAELVAGIDFLTSHDAVDGERIGTMGISMGGTHAWWLAALDTRVRACVQMCCFADLACLVEGGQHAKHGHYMTVPGLLQVTSTGALAGLAAPRPQLVCVGLRDWSSPAPCFERARRDMTAAYAAKEATGGLVFHVDEEAGHEETAGMRSAVLQFLGRHLVP